MSNYEEMVFGLSEILSKRDSEIYGELIKDNKSTHVEDWSSEKNGELSLTISTKFLEDVARNMIGDHDKLNLTIVDANGDVLYRKRASTIYKEMPVAVAYD